MDEKIQTTDGRLYTYDLPSLEVGDILLSTTEQLVSRVIRGVTRSDFSHAMLYVRNTIIHADGDGVFTTNPQRRFFSHGSSVVLRLIKPNSVDLDAVCQFALNLAGSLYSVPEAMFAAVADSTRQAALSNTQFCSRLVAQAYASVGHPLVGNSDYCVPGSFLHCPLLEVVPGAIRPALEHEIAIGKKVDTVKLHQTNTFKWLRQTRDLSKRVCGKPVANILDALVFVIENPKFDEEVAVYISNSGYLTDYEFDCPANPHRYDIHLFRSILRNAANREEVVQQELRINSDIASAAIADVEQYSKFPLKVFQLLRDMNIRRLQQIQVRVKILLKICYEFGFESLSEDADSLFDALSATIEAMVETFDLA